MKNINTELLIVGAGLTGLCTAGILSGLGYKIAIIDKNKLGEPYFKTGDSRTTAISEGSKKILNEFGFWKKIAPYSEPIKKIKVCDRKTVNKIEFSNDKVNENLGYIVENKILKKIFYEKITKCKNIKIIDEFDVNYLDTNSLHISIKSEKKIINSNLLIAADGKFSPLRKLLKITTFEKNYNHSALFLNILHAKNHNNQAFEIFKQSGPLAILPMKKKHNSFQSSIIWSHNPNFIKGIVNSDNLNQVIKNEVSHYLGNIKKISNKKIFNLSAHINSTFYSDRVVFVGDSAHSVHPIAGQGWNLGIRDIHSLFKVLKEGKELGLELGNNTVLRKYNNKTFYDAFILYHITDKLNSVFSVENILVKKLRNLGIDYIDNNKTINSLIASYAMGKKINLFNWLKNTSS